MNRTTSLICLLLLLLTLSTVGTNHSSSARNVDAENTLGSRTQSRTQESQSLTDRIKRVEDGLLPPFVIKGQPSALMKLADRMKFYNTPGCAQNFQTVRHHSRTSIISPMS